MHFFIGNFKFSYTSWSQFSIFDCILLSDTWVNEGNSDVCEIAVARSSGFLLLRPLAWHCKLLLGTLISDLWFKLSSFDMPNLLSICVSAYPVWSVSKVSRSSWCEKVSKHYSTLWCLSQYGVRLIETQKNYGKSKFCLRSGNDSLCKHCILIN